jgi:peroxiredoxin
MITIARTCLTVVLAITLLIVPVTVSAARVGEAAPAFSGIDTNGVSRRLSDFKGKWVVLEWHHPGCPYTKKHYESGNMQKLQGEWTGKGVVWLTVVASPMTPEAANTMMRAQKAKQTAIWIDADATLAKAYQAKTSPHMFVIDPQGTLIYNGAIDDKPTTDVADVPGAHNYVAAALAESQAGHAVVTPTSRPYGCAVKYVSTNQ